MSDLVDPVMETWAPDTRHYVTSAGQHVAVHVAAEMNELTTNLLNESLEASGMTLQSGVNTVVVEPTTVFECSEDGAPITLTPIRTFPPGTTHEDALTQLEQE